ncbi:hypothetical protein BaRGS_00026603 [Batillaria attramentaria]|uniref:Uncharacterized protein n=1 Tax=Batillaria attramentaria TaxID=370345 RepID=A0ABD0K586_9CAEN
MPSSDASSYADSLRVGIVNNHLTGITDHHGDGKSEAAPNASHISVRSTFQQSGAGGTQPGVDDMVAIGLSAGHTGTAVPPVTMVTDYQASTVTMVTDYQRADGVADALTAVRNLETLGNYFHPSSSTP